MKKNGFLTAGLLAVAALAFTTPASAITLDFAAISGGQVQFAGSGDTFRFLPTTSSQNQFRITGSDGAGDSVDLFGRMDGSFSIGSITTIGSLQTASVSGSGQLIIHDGSTDLTGTLVWDSIATIGTGGIINVNGSLNLSSISYSGNNNDLKALAAPGAGSEVISFQFVPGKTLTQLTADGKVFTTSFSGSISAADVSATPVPDSGSTLLLLGATLTGLGLFFRRQAA